MTGTAGKILIFILILDVFAFTIGSSVPNFPFQTEQFFSDEFITGNFTNGTLSNVTTNPQLGNDTVGGTSGATSNPQQIFNTLFVSIPFVGFVFAFLASPMGLLIALQVPQPIPFIVGIMLMVGLLFGFLSFVRSGGDF